MKTIKICLMTLICVLFSQANADCGDLYRAKGLVPESAEMAIQCYEKEASNPNQQNQLSYLWFFRSEHELSENIQAADSALKKSLIMAETNAKSFGPFLDYEAYSKLSNSQARELSRALYIYAVTLSRQSEKAGVTEIMTQWPLIQKTLKMILRLKNTDVEFYGAQRTLAIANTRMPAPFGDKKLAREYFESIIKKTDQGNALSSFLDNNLFYAELLWNQDFETETCAELKKISDVTDAQIASRTPLHIFENLQTRQNAKEQFNQKCQPLDI